MRSWRALLLLAAIGCVALPVLERRGGVLYSRYAWPLVGIALVLAAVAAWNVPLPGTASSLPPAPATRRRRIAGLLLLLAGLALWIWAPLALLANWAASFDRGWVSWLVGTALIGFGLDQMWGRWERPRAERGRWWWGALALLLVIAAVYRFGTFYFFRGESHITQIEELQVGAMGTAYLMGWRHRWEYLSHAWLAALGIWLGGPNLFAMRTPFIVISILKVVPVFLWLRFAAGNAAAVVGTALMACSAWDVTYSRSPTNQNAFIVAATFTLLAGPARRGRFSPYAWLGLFGGYVLFEYVGYRLVGLFALAGGAIASLRATGPWWARLAHPALTTALITAMGVTLYLHLERTGQMYQYFDGWGRARANAAYYRAEDDLGARAQRIGQRSLQAVGLFYFNGDEAPTRNLDAEPLIDPVTGALLLLGVAYGIANPLRGMSGLAVAALAMTLGGTLVATGNFDPVRAGGTVPLVYGLAGYGAACLLEVLTSAWGRWGRRFGIVLLAAGVLVAAADNTRFLWEFLQSPIIRQNQFRDIAYLSGWVGENTQPGEHVLAIAPGNSYLFEGNDAIWMRGVATKGTATWDINTALERWRSSNQPTLFMVYAAGSTPDVQRYLSWLLPRVPLALVPGPKGPESDLAYSHLPASPAELHERLPIAERCSIVTAVYRILGNDDAELSTSEAKLPFIDRTTWPHKMLSDVWYLQAQTKDIRVQFNASFNVERAGEYVFTPELFPGTGDLFIDGELVKANEPRPLFLAPGRHTLELRATYQPRSALPSARMMWQGPDTQGEKQLMPFYRLGDDPACRAQVVSKDV